MTKILSHSEQLFISAILIYALRLNSHELFLDNKIGAITTNRYV